ncbi:MAG TPA: hypothetical protein VJ323_14245, partial [Bryobacteraceae bacterium]|nr:hypothetical protein [Bryobacteraceae bacterium]
RVAAERHFPSDAVIGIAAGYLIGHYVFKAHHNRDLAEEAAPAEPPLRAAPAPVASARPAAVSAR